MTDTTAPGTVRFRDVTKFFGDTVALRGLNLDIAPGTLVTLLGPSGCGKTTTLRLIAGLESPTSGIIEIGGRDVTRLAATYRRVSMVFQSYALFPHMSVARNVSYGLDVRGTKGPEARARAEDALALVGLGGFGARLPSELSGGQQQRVAVARAIVLEPEVLLLDEPLSNLDAKLRRRVRAEIRAIQQRLGLTAIYVTHDQEEAMAVSDRIVVMRDAAIAQEGVPSDLYERPASGFVADFIGDANLIPCEVVAEDGVGAQVIVAGQRISLPNAHAPRGPAQLVLRPHQITLSRRAGPGTFPVEIVSAAWLGHRIEYEAAGPLGPVFVAAPPSADPFRPGEGAHAGFVRSDARLVTA